MTPTRLREVLDTLHWSQRDLAGVLMCNERLVRRWAAGNANVPPAIVSWLESRFLQHQMDPPPADWKRREPVGSVIFGDDPDDFHVVNEGR